MQNEMNWRFNWSSSINVMAMQNKVFFNEDTINLNRLILLCESTEFVTEAIFLNSMPTEPEPIAINWRWSLELRTLVVKLKVLN